MYLVSRSQLSYYNETLISNHVHVLKKYILCARAKPRIWAYMQLFIKKYTQRIVAVLMYTNLYTKLLTNLLTITCATRQHTRYVDTRYRGLQVPRTT